MLAALTNKSLQVRNAREYKFLLFFLCSDPPGMLVSRRTERVGGHPASLQPMPTKTQPILPRCHRAPGRTDSQGPGNNILLGT